MHSRGSEDNRTVINLTQAVEESLHLAYHSMRAKDTSFNADFATAIHDPDCEVRVVPQDFQRVLLNLLNNAFFSVQEKKQTQQDLSYHPMVKVSSSEDEKNVYVHVYDNGFGIPEKQQKEIFNPFFTTKPSGHGTGLGLSISYEIITKIHGGEITVSSRPKEYAEFTITLPKE